jgi:HTH-type transcriptional regulator/antitoxin HipB
MDQPWPPVSDPTALGAAIRRARSERGWDQAELATRIGVTRMTLSKVERGHTGSVGTALRALSECGYAVVLTPKAGGVAADAVPDPSDG